MKRLVAATKNPGKAREIARVLEGASFEVVSLADYPGAPDVEETGATFHENAILKARVYARYTGELTLADDSGLEVDALDGAPGVFSSRFAASDPERIEKLLAALADVPDERRTARFRCAIAIADPQGRATTCQGKLEGVIAREPRGNNGFGYDPVFYVPDIGKCLAELPADEKNAISHRGEALSAAKKLLEGYRRLAPS